MRLQVTVRFFTLLFSAALLSGCVRFNSAPAKTDGQGQYQLQVGDRVQARLSSDDSVTGKLTAVTDEEIEIDGRRFPLNALDSLEVRTFSLAATTVNTVLLGAGIGFAVATARYLALKAAID